MVVMVWLSKRKNIPSFPLMVNYVGEDGKLKTAMILETGFCRNRVTTI